jgi:hypothetical protein
MTDILIDNHTYQPMIAEGDWRVGFSDNQHQALLLLTAQGEWKEKPDVGVGARRWAEAEIPDGLLREIRQQYTADGMVISTLLHDERTGKLLIDASYRTTQASVD